MALISTADLIFSINKILDIGSNFITRRFAHQMANETYRKQRIKVLFMGRKDVAARCLQHLLDHQGVQVVGVLTDSHLEVSPTAVLARSKSLRLFDFESALTAIESGELSFDLGVSMLYWRKLRDGFLSTPRQGIINFHPAPLPEYKGVGGYNLAILECLHRWAVSAHYVDKEIDEGDIIETRYFPIDVDTETIKSLEARSQSFLFSLFVDTSERLVSSGSRLETTPNNGGRYITRTQLEEMKGIDFEKDDVARKVRAFWFPPYDGAYIKVNGSKFTLVDRSILDALADPANSSLFTKVSRL